MSFLKIWHHLHYNQWKSLECYDRRTVLSIGFCAVVRLAIFFASQKEHVKRGVSQLCSCCHACRKCPLNGAVYSHHTLWWLQHLWKTDKKDVHSLGGTYLWGCKNILGGEKIMRVQTILFQWNWEERFNLSKYLIGTNIKHGGLLMWELKERKDRIKNYSEIPWMTGLKMNW